ncbi:agmatine deiminase family protein [Hoeflea prorocentri]|uniref:Agmatine deiminase family protein n=1 Tax=Hoeflea prorocentri TaxID=1922333 RepID=A0A9X3UHU8_9HYPH|nr:agmatine deiminase family protein [Hoeflea prorocentri]MCY6381100.1 agmatine deiminase family protein [Hoeflea prorocentri]MDA5398900.1 agmatine deiminase family protein [Hoeflea prorocentri]
MQGSARENGYYFPEEAHPHLRTFMQWPSNRTVHSDPVFLRMLQESIAEIANTISAFEPVVLLMDASQENAARRYLSSDVEIWPIATDDLWCRDSGPVFLTDGRGGLAVTQLNFNGWGNKQVHNNDAKVAERVAARLGLHIFDNPVVGELGGLEADGEGTLIAHESSWVNPNRNSVSRQKVEHDLLQALGAEKMIWAPGIAGADITDYHIDSLARFVAPGMILIQLPKTLDPDEPWSAAAFQTYDILRSATDASGRHLDITVIPEPERTRVKSADFVASYVNYYVCNGAIVAAQFGDAETDSEARRILGQLYPDREVVMLDIDPIGETGGGIHCATQQQPQV